MESAYRLFRANFCLEIFIKKKLGKSCGILVIYTWLVGAHFDYVFEVKTKVITSANQMKGKHIEQPMII